MSTTACRARVIGDAARLRQVLLNLAGNAVKFTERGGVADHRRARRLAGRDHASWCATPASASRPTQQERIFHEFEQADGGVARKFGGTGLGLAISRRIVERMGGRIAVESAPGAGSTFRVTRAAAARPATTRRPFAAPDLAGADVLIVAPPRSRPR